MKKFTKLKVSSMEKNDSNYKLFMVNHAYFVFYLSVVHRFLLCRNEEKLVALLVYSSFKCVAPSGFRIIPYSLVVKFVF